MIFERKLSLLYLAERFSINKSYFLLLPLFLEIIFVLNLNYTNEFSLNDFHWIYRIQRIKIDPKVVWPTGDTPYVTIYS